MKCLSVFIIQMYQLGETFATPNVEGPLVSEVTSLLLSSNYNKGNHGWDNTFSSMQAICMALGSPFNDNVASLFSVLFMYFFKIIFK